jgi:prophage maintenance system killer protein
VILFELLRGENHPVYRALEVENGNRQYDFMRSLIEVAIATSRAFLSQHIIKMFNFHAIACLHTNAGEYRPCQVTVGAHTPPNYWQVAALMEDFTNEVNKHWDTTDLVYLAAFVYWKINYIHPFINGNGRTARVTAFYVLCLKLGGLMQGDPALPALLKRDKDECCAALQAAHVSFNSGALDISHLHTIFTRLISEQVASVAPQATA